MDRPARTTSSSIYVVEAVNTRMLALLKDGLNREGNINYRISFISAPGLLFSESMQKGGKIKNSFFLSFFSS
jgi:hypothetical protein